MNRRQLLQCLGLGAAGIALPFSRRARGDDTAPKRLLIISTNHGTVFENWKIRGEGDDDTTEFERDISQLPESAFSTILAPLWPWRQKMLVLDGLALCTAESETAGFRHPFGCVHAWTGDKGEMSENTVFATNISIDQLVAAAISRDDRLPSLELAVLGTFSSGMGGISWAGDRAQLPAEADPAMAYQRLYNLATGLTGAEELVLTSQDAVLDFAIAESAQLTPTLDTAAQERLTQHYALLDSLKARIIGMSEATCEAPVLPTRPSETPERYDSDVDVMGTLIASAFGCDLTRVATLLLDDMPGDLVGAIGDDIHGDYAHEVYTSADAVRVMTEYSRKHAEHVASILAKLEATPDVDGGSVLDNTLVVWGGEMADGAHGYQDWPAVIIGGGWYFSLGRVIRWTESTPVSGQDWDGQTRLTMGKPHQHLLVSIAQCMGLDVDHVGIASLVGNDGSMIDLTGPLDRVTG